MFCLPLLQRLLLEGERGARTSINGGIGAPAALIIAPTRELAAQTADVLKSFVAVRNNSSNIDNNRHSSSSTESLNVCLATGGSDIRNQRQQLASCDVLVGTPGRILQFADERKLSLGSVSYLVVDEADRLLDMGFEPQLTRIARSLQQGRRSRGGDGNGNGNNDEQQQSVLCSATFPQGVQRLAADFLRPEYYFVSVGKVGSTHSNIRQRFEWVNNFYGSNNNNNNNNRNNNNNNRNYDPKEEAVVRNVQRFWEQTAEAGAGAATKTPHQKKQSSVIVFTNTKDGSELYGKALSKLGNKDKNTAGAVRVIHGDK